MEEQYKKTFDQMVDSLKMYQRYELKDKNRKDILDKVYVDPIENDGILNLCLKDNTTVLIGRRGTGKSTIFMRMQNELRKQNDIMTCYIDVKSIFDVAKRNYITINYLKTSNLEEIEQYSIQRQFILDFVDELINEICKNYDTIWEKFKQKLHISKSQKAIDKLKNIRKRIQDNNHLSDVPSAEQVAEEGYSQHDMNKILLQKIEELTLYTIRQQKEIDSLKAQLQESKK